MKAAPVFPAGPGNSTSSARDHYPDQRRQGHQTHRRHRRRERLLRPLLRHLSECSEPTPRHLALHPGRLHADALESRLQRPAERLRPALAPSMAPARPTPSATTPFRPLPATRSTATARNKLPPTTARWISSPPTWVRPRPPTSPTRPPRLTNATAPGLTMGYYDGNTVTALWNYAQHYALNDHAFGTTFGHFNPRCPQPRLRPDQRRHQRHQRRRGYRSPMATAAFTAIGDADPVGDICTSSSARPSACPARTSATSSTPLKITWGYFQGGFDLSVTNSDGSTGCARTSTSKVTNIKKADYVPHHQPFQYYASTANPNHLRPTAANRQPPTRQTTSTTRTTSPMPSPPATCLRSASSRPPATRTATPATRTRSTSRPSSSTSSTLSSSPPPGARPPSFSPGTTPTAGTITRSRLVNGSATSADALNGAASASARHAAANALAGVNVLHPPRPGTLRLRPPSSAASSSHPGQRRTRSTPRSPTRPRSPDFIEDTFALLDQNRWRLLRQHRRTLLPTCSISQTVPSAPNPNVVLLDPKTGLVTSKN